jgi:hypothetical protein
MGAYLSFVGFLTLVAMTVTLLSSAGLPMLPTMHGVVQFASNLVNAPLP